MRVGFLGSQALLGICLRLVGTPVCRARPVRRRRGRFCDCVGTLEARTAAGNGRQTRSTAARREGNNAVPQVLLAPVKRFCELSEFDFATCNVQKDIPVRYGSRGTRALREANSSMAERFRRRSGYPDRFLPSPRTTPDQ
jgi:hypothetical protein